MDQYVPKPIDTSLIELPSEINLLTEKLAENTHDVWALGRLRDGWTYGETRDDAQKKHPCLVPYDQLPDSEKEYDRNTVLETLRAIYALGFRISHPNQ